MNLNIKEWKEFVLGKLFIIKKGKRLTAAEQEDGENNYIGNYSFCHSLAYLQDLITCKSVAYKHVALARKRVIAFNITNEIDILRI